MNPTNTQILIPIAGYSSFFPEDEYYFPKPLVEVAGKPMVELVIRQFKSQFKNPKFIFVIDSQDVVKFSLDKIISLIAGSDVQVVIKNAKTSGALCSCLLAIDAIDQERPLIISNSDQIIECGLANIIQYFTDNCATAGVASFQSVHPRWSYITCDESNLVAQAFEKDVRSNQAIAGFYYYQTAREFVESAKKVIVNDSSVEGAYFISSTLNEIILNGGRVMHSPVPSNSYHSFFSPSKIKEFELTRYAALVREDIDYDAFVNVVIPAAGRGSRFKKAGWEKPKPLIDVNGKAMIDAVIENVKCQSSRVTLLLQSEDSRSHDSQVASLTATVDNVIDVPFVTEGTASTILLGRSAFDNDHPLLIANSDQIVDFNVNDFVADCRERNLDGSILVFKDLDRDEKWSFVNVDESGFVTEVAEKKAISDLATVGIYLFMRGSDFVASAIDMIASNDRVNNEFYTCPVYNYMIRDGMKIGVYIVASSSMHGLGTPDDLRQYLIHVGASPSEDDPAK